MFYGAFIVNYLLILAGVIAVDYVAGLWIARLSGAGRRLALLASIVANCSILFLFKYFDFALSSAASALQWFHVPFEHSPLGLVLPIGLSFHVFQSLSYTIEVYLGRQEPERDLATYALYVLYFPQLVAGPIERPQNLLPQFHRLGPLTVENLSPALRLIASGLVKKCVVADNLTILVDRVYADPRAFGALALWAATFLFSIQIYCDFSGYSSIARGCSRLFGVTLMENFKTPYHAKSIGEFWQRWHISLSSWFRDYVYLPLGGSRGAVWRTHRNVFIVFLLSGVWHGANWVFVLWGLWHGIGLMIENGLARRTHRGTFRLGAPFTFLFVLLGWVLFRARSVGDASYIFGHLWMDWTRGLASLPPRALEESLVLAVALLLIEYFSAKVDLWNCVSRAAMPIRVMAYAALVFVFFVVGQFSGTQFIYFQF